MITGIKMCRNNFIFSLLLTEFVSRKLSAVIRKYNGKQPVKYRKHLVLTNFTLLFVSVILNFDQKQINKLT